MRHKVYAVTLLIGVMTLFAGAAVAQHEEHHPQSQAPQGQTQPTQPSPAQPGMMGQGMTGQGGMGGMMGMMMNMMMGQMGQMMSQHQEMNDTMTKLMQSMTAIENEKDPAALKAKIAEHRALMEQMRGQMMQQGGMMQMMMGGMGGTSTPAGDSAKPSTK